MLNLNRDNISKKVLLGFDDSVMAMLDGVAVHQDIIAPLTLLKSAAAKAGFDLRVVSGFRSFERQLAIWNAKATGERVLLDDTGQVLEWAALSESELIAAILRWSALPGASRHHWGTDVDVYDAAAVASDYRVQLTPAEVADNGVFGPLHQWLDGEFAAGRGCGFFRPYNLDRGGIAPERWHLSYAPLAAVCDWALGIEVLEEALKQREDLRLKDTILRELPSIYRRYVAVPASCYPLAFVEALSGREAL
ncbi:MAG: M15 family metallopeptidase [Gammaproteobacteria bacterium]|nr:M15 family metallopeptidase [Gammaproteobacteria bacterium]MBU1833063.1 M15 family metallopeptidase [Gammaproteobacteria bacterium]